ncbi:hypothetical protein BGS_1093 [Beggiatoa sp. SS]|nr:hypothetical protein BGS_1093 [Beggiatoa sp. SS]
MSALKMALTLCTGTTDFLTDFLHLLGNQVTMFEFGGLVEI